MPSPIRLGVIGYGGRARHMVQTMRDLDPQVHLTAIADPQGDSIGEHLRSSGYGSDLPRIYPTADEMLDNETLDGVVIGTRCSLHAKMAVKVLERNIALFLEKPAATTMPDLLALRAAKHPRIVVSFPLRLSRVVNLARKIIEAGTIGMVEHVQSWNNVPYGDVYYQTWYRDENETHGLFLQKATHDFDYIHSLLGDNQPQVVSAMTSKRVFRGDHVAGLKCMDCPERQVCFESPYHRFRHSPLALDQPSGMMCAFAVDTGNEDSSSALIQYESGMHVAYSQNFYARKKAGRRGATLIGYDGTIEFDWYPERLKVYLHHEDRVETHDFESGGDHGGGDSALAANFLAVIRGEEESKSPIDNALLNTLLCLKARESAATRQFQDIQWPVNDVSSDPVLNGHAEREFARIV